MLKFNCFSLLTASPNLPGSSRMSLSFVVIQKRSDFRIFHYSPNINIIIFFSTFKVNMFMLDLDVGFLDNPMKLVEGKHQIWLTLFFSFLRDLFPFFFIRYHFHDFFCAEHLFIFLFSSQLFIVISNFFIIIIYIF